MIKAIIFDWGNVLEFYDNAKLSAKMSQHLKVDRKLFEELELKNRIKHDLGEISTKEFVYNISQGLNRKFSTKEYYSLVDRFKVKKLNSSLINVIKKLRRDYPIYLLSNNSSPTYIKIKKLKLDKLFDKILFSYQVGIKKPNPKFLGLLLDKTNVLYSDCIFIDDKEDTCKFAQKLGMKTITFKDNSQLKKDLASFKLHQSSKKSFPLLSVK